MKKLFIMMCRKEGDTVGLDTTELYFSPHFEHTFRKFADAMRLVNPEYEVVNSSTYTLKGVSRDIDYDLDDIIVYTHPLAFMARRECVEEAIRHVMSSELACATIGKEENFYAVVSKCSILTDEANIESPEVFFAHIRDYGTPVDTISLLADECAEPSDSIEYARRSERYRQEMLDYLCAFGIKIQARDGIVVSPASVVGEGTTILPNTQIIGHSTVGKACLIGPNTIISGSVVCDECVVDSSYIYASTVEKNVEIGPFCHLSGSCHTLTGSRLLAYSKIKNVTVGASSTIHEHCLIEHTEIGAKVMIGSGTRTINYDGRKQSECKIADGTFIGAGVNLVAPVVIGMGAYIAAGSTITDDVPVGALAIAREYQSNHDNWAKRRKR